MHRMLFVLAVALLLGATAPAVIAAPTAFAPIRTAERPITLVQGWWERENRWEDARRRYWRLSPAEMYRYNQLQAEINSLRQRREEIERRLRHALREQHRMLGFQQ